MKPRIPYYSYPLSPYLVAQAVCDEVYTGCEMTGGVHDAEKIEALRRKFVGADGEYRYDNVRRFAQLCNDRCRNAYNGGEPWIVKIMRSKTNHGRDTLYNFIRHWLAAELLQETHRENSMA